MSDVRLVKQMLFNSMNGTNERGRERRRWRDDGAALRCIHWAK